MQSPRISLNVRSRASRAIWLATAAVIAIGGAFGAAQIMPVAPAIAQNNQAPAVQAPRTVAAVASFADVIERVRGAVVSVKVTAGAAVGEDQPEGFGRRGVPRAQPGDPLERFFRQFRDEDGAQRRPQRRGMSQGSGFIVSADGYVVTNNHVVRNAAAVTLTLDNGKSVTARIVGTDEKTDLALLKINEAGSYTFVEFADGAPRVGDWVVAIGNPFGLGGTVTAGIVSARGRDIGAGPYDDFLQIDAPVNRGNSGGPTFDLTGRVVGVNTAIYSPSGGSVGIGFAIPSNVAKTVIASLRENGTVSRGFIGVQLQPMTPDIAQSLGVTAGQGALIADVQPGLPAAAAGLRAGDIITAVNGDKIANPRDLARKIAGLGPNQKAEISYRRDGAERKATLTLAGQPDNRRAMLEPGNARERIAPAAPEGRFGMTLAPAASVPGAGEAGAVVVEIAPDGIAARQGLRSGDVILDVAGKPVASPADVSAAIEQARRERRPAVLLRVRSGENTRFVALAVRAS